MTINSVNFRGTEADPFSDIVGKPQAYQEKAAASSSVKGDEFKKEHKGAKAVGKLALAAAAIATALGLGSKYGVFTNEKVKNETLKTVLGAFDTAGKFIGEKAETVWKAAKDLISNVKGKAEKAADTVGEKAAEVAEEVVS